MGRAWSLYKLRKYEESYKDYERVLEIKPDYQVEKDNQEIVRKKLTIPNNKRNMVKLVKNIHDCSQVTGR